MVVGVEGGGEKFSDGEILKTTTVGPLQYDDYYAVLLSRAPVRSNMDEQFSITSPKTPTESIDDLTSMNRQARTNERTSKYTAPPNPQGDRPRSMRSLAGINY